jgi:hypothetical protein
MPFRLQSPANLFQSLREWWRRSTCGSGLPLDSVHEEASAEEGRVEGLSIIGDERAETAEQLPHREEELRLTGEVGQEELLHREVPALAPRGAEQEDDAPRPAGKAGILRVVEDQVLRGRGVRRKRHRPSLHAPAGKMLPASVDKLPFPRPAGEARIWLRRHQASREDVQDARNDRTAVLGLTDFSPGGRGHGPDLLRSADAGRAPVLAGTAVHDLAGAPCDPWQVPQEALRQPDAPRVLVVDVDAGRLVVGVPYPFREPEIERITEQEDRRDGTQERAHALDH